MATSMVQIAVIHTKRLILRPWREADFSPFAKINADRRVMECFPAILSSEESDRLAEKISQETEKKGWGFWAVEVIRGAPFIGFIGLGEVDASYPFSPAVEIGWRLAYDFWNQGYATEGAQGALQYGFQTLHLREIVSFTPVGNLRSRKVMEKIGMKRDPRDDFDHPKIAANSLLRRHVLYRLKAI